MLRVDGTIAGAFDREHDTIVVAPSSNERTLTLEVELASLPTHGLPNGPGARWTLMQRRKAERPRDRIEIVDAPELNVAPMPDDPLPLWRTRISISHGCGRSQKAVAKVCERWRTRCTSRDARRITSSFKVSPRCTRYVEHDDPEFFARIAEAVRKGQIDPSVAAPWVETDCNIPSGETLLRQLVHGMNYVHERFGIVPIVAWLPDTFGFPNTLPQLLAHAGVRFFATAKLQWNETTRWPHPQFVWMGPDRSGVVGAVLDGYEGGASPERVAKARERQRSAGRRVRRRRRRTERRNRPRSGGLRALDERPNVV